MNSRHELPEVEGEGNPLTWTFSLGGGPDDPAVQEAQTGARKTPGEVFQGSMQFKDGKLRIGGGDTPAFEWKLSSGEEPPVYEPFPILNSIRTWVGRIVRGLAIAIPIVLIGLGVATGQSSETVVFMAIFGLILSTMLISSFSPPKTVVSSVLESYLKDALRKHYEEPALTPESAPDPASPSAPEAISFTIKCASCGMAFEPKPPRAICPSCSMPNVDA